MTVLVRMPKAMNRSEFDDHRSAIGAPPGTATTVGPAPGDRAGARWFLRGAVTVAALGVLAMHVDRQRLLAELASLSPASIAAAVMLIMFQALVAAERWHYLNDALGIA